MNIRARILLRTGVLFAVVGVVSLFVAWSEGGLPVAHAFHNKQELAVFKAGGGLPGGQNTYFMSSGNCEGCHGHDFNAFAMITGEGVDVNVVDDWRSTMMANSALDPFWRAKVSHEILVNPAHQVALEDKCTSCHAPQGRHEKHMLGLGPYSIAEMEQDPIALDGVSCVPCHIQSADSIGQLFSGNMRFDTLGRPLYGQYSDNIFGSPMSSFVGYEPLYGEHITDAGLCASCHTLITETADLNGDLTGGEFVEQGTYHEWLNSAFNTEEHPDGITCQGCHVPRIDEGVVLSANYIFLQPRAPFGMHHFAGGNVFMLKLLKENREALGLAANDVQFDSTIARTYRNLQQQSLLLDASLVSRDTDTAFVEVHLTNLTGHKFPSGYPSRRAWVQLDVLDADGDTLFQSGAWSDAYEVEGHPTDYFPHFDVITSGTQAQIYEMVMGDVNGDKTTVLERASTKLKDNKLAPLGFSTTHITYDTTTVAGVPASDIDFNHDDMGVEGSGTDKVHYHVPMNGYTGLITVKARVWYQSVPPLWNQEMFSYNSAEIDSFRTMYEAADNSPILVQADSLTDNTMGIDDIAELGVRVFPNPATDGTIAVSGLTPLVDRIDVYDLGGRLLRSVVPMRQRSVQIPIATPGTYMVVFRARDKVFTQRVIVN